MRGRAAEVYDYVIVGAGTAGCLLANRLSADPSVRVLLLEAGGEDDWIWFHIPVGYLFAIGNPRADWMFETDPISGLGGRTLGYPRGKVLGGSSAINAMIYMRGQKEDYDRWRDMGLSGWGWSDVRPLFLSHEDHFSPGPHHGSGGEWRVETPRMKWKVLDAFADAAEAAGVPKCDDFNTGDNFGTGYFQVNQKRGRRWSAARGFLHPVRRRRNLRIETGAHADRVIIRDGRAVGVAWSRGTDRHVSECSGEVILAAGAVASPKLLELSGVGGGERLRSLGVEVVCDRPGVGENLQDHLQLRPIYRVHGVATMNEQYAQQWRRPIMALDYILRRRGPMTMAPSQLGAFARSSPERATPDLQFHVQPLSLDKFGEELHRFPAITISVCNLRPESRGSVHIVSSDERAAPSIQPNYLSTDGDLETAVRALRLVRTIVGQPSLACFSPVEVRPGAHAASDQELRRAASEIGATIFHPVGTARMGMRGDPAAVVDERLRVIGVAALRVIDASVMPTITSGNTNSPTLMIAEKGARMVMEDARTGRVG
ncbi:MAG: GMC family oxidoreductase N-terminal domain-containing protein [Alphaproteobacteria bacterium]|nr:GMC family oxidoreductase N-terminal domain-containing protein [Alphaproteobacteria bacterium]